MMHYSGYIKCGLRIFLSQAETQKKQEVFFVSHLFIYLYSTFHKTNCYMQGCFTLNHKVPLYIKWP